MAQDGNLIRNELERLLASDFLRRSPSHLRLLRYLVERRLANDDGALREMSIGIEVFIVTRQPTIRRTIPSSAST